MNIAGSQARDPKSNPSIEKQSIRPGDQADDQYILVTKLKTNTNTEELTIDTTRNRETRMSIAKEKRKTKQKT